MEKQYLEKIIICPQCQNARLQKFADKIICLACAYNYPIIKGVPVLVINYKDEIYDGQINSSEEAEQWNWREKILDKIPKILFKYIFFATYAIRDFINQAAKDFAPGALILDAGAGECIYKKYFSHTNYLAADLGVGSNFWNYTKVDFLADLEKIPLRNDCLDGIICSEVLEHTSSPDKIFLEFYRILKPNGRLILTVPAGGGIHQAPHHFYSYTKYGLEYLARMAGFKIKFIKPEGGFFKYIAQQKSFLREILISKFKNAPLYLKPFYLCWLSIHLIYTPFSLLFANALDKIDHKQNFTLGYLCNFYK
ncbi:MAG: hypothetical protein A2Y82_01870 [Candidatus Buchananbacteria bacterium RBG_13_36_9]|uniref:Methyltransferase type 11 domain-containing protein n=1 Tax=Candidatus Buchananbacteria bacterium RBG_13_36_9 TaxID=1797530 RepID=A0A1G1XMP6_9BACT|nr:MAG: hypothetical protein A2Y82_01870 [Candidatus Buchananbacteria bacterium RBG_13_36_9]